MQNTTNAGHLADYAPQVVLQAVLATNLTSFTEFAFGVVRPDIVFKPNWHFEAVTHKLSEVASGEVRRLIITLPPRNLKSLCASVALPAWFLGRNPSERVVVVSYSDVLARTHANDFRLVVNHPIYQASFPAMRLERDTDREITTTKRGKRFATSIDGTLTGLGGNLIIIDDPLKLGDAMSESVRSRVIEWYRSTLLSRADDKKAARIVLVMQRVHQDDLAGYLQEQGGFEVLNLPAIAQRNETYFLGDGRTYDRQKGELLHPEHEPAHVLAELKREMGPIAFSAQYQQSPIPPGGAIIKRKWLTPYDDIRQQSGDRIIMSWDIALSEQETGDYSACVVLLRRKEVFYILEVVRGRFPFDMLKRKVMEVKQRNGSSTLLIEDSPISRGLIQSLREKSINVTTYKPDTDKRARVIAQTDLFAGGSVRFPRRAAWLEDFTAELLAFPGRHDDQVDALTQGVAWGRVRRGRFLRVPSVECTNRSVRMIALRLQAC
jgi:predicted phage terminase large subunit-like protein